MLQLLLLGLAASIVAAERLVYPPTCEPDNSCTYMVDWTVKKDHVEFTIVAKQPDTAWTGIGFSKENPMEKAEFLYGYKNSEGNGVAFDGFIPDSNSAPVKDPLQKLISSTVDYKDGHLTVKISHPRVTNEPYEYSFTDTDCYYFLLPVEGGSIVDDHGIINKPYNIQKTIDRLICFNETSEESTMSTVSMETITSLHLDEKRGKLVHPPLCESTSSCLYKVEWELDTTEDVIKYKIEAKQDKKTWTGLGFTDNLELKGTDVVLGYISEKGMGPMPAFNDGWAENRDSKIETDPSQDVLDPKNVEYDSVAGLLKMSFSRKRHLSDLKDLSFTDVECHYLVLPIGGGELLPDEESDKKLGDKAVVSNEKICIRAKEESTMSTVSMETVTNLLGVTKPSVHDSTTTFGLPIGVDDVRSSTLPESSITMSYDDEKDIERLKEWKFPMNCIPLKTCVYRMWYSIDRVKDEITFNVEAKQSDDTWTGIGFVKDDKAISRADYYFGLMLKNGEGQVNNGFINNLVDKPEKDNEPDYLLTKEITCSDGYLRLHFSRKRNLTNSRDADLTDEDCLHLVFPVEGGKRNDDDSIEKPYKPMRITKTKICFREEDYTKTTSLHLTTDLPSGIDDIVYKRICYYSYLAQYREGNAKCLPEDLNPALCTHLVLAYANLTTDHKLIPMEPSDITPDGLYKRFNNLKTKSDVKTLLAVGGKDLGTNAMTQMLLTPETRLTCINSAIALLRENGFDGLSVDFEYPGSQDKPHYTNFLKELNEAFVSEAQTSGKKKLILTATVAGLTDIIEKGYEADKIHEYLEFINVMTYNLLNESDKVTEHHSTVYPSHNSPNDEKNMVFVANYWVKKGVPKKKLVVGISAAARGFKLADPNIHGIGAPVVGPSPPGECTKEEGILSYYEICMLLNDTLTTTVELADEKVSYLYTNNTWMGYDNPKSLETKVNVLKSEGYAGWMVSMADLDDFKGEYCNQGIYPLISILSKTLIGSVTGTLPPLSKILESTKSLVHTRETMTTIGHNIMSTLPDVCKVGVEDGLYPHPTDCKMYVRCTGGQETFLICLPEKPYYEPSIRDCTTQGYLSAERKKECNVH